MSPFSTTRGDSEIQVTALVESDVQKTEQDQAADCEYLPMDVYVDAETRHARFRYKPELANRRK